jgi:hypothetical protein
MRIKSSNENSVIRALQTIFTAEEERKNEEESRLAALRRAQEQARQEEEARREAQARKVAAESAARAEHEARELAHKRDLEERRLRLEIESKERLERERLQVGLAVARGQDGHTLVLLERAQRSARILGVSTSLLAALAIGLSVWFVASAQRFSIVETSLREQHASCGATLEDTTQSIRDARLKIEQLNQSSTEARRRLTALEDKRRP